MVMMDSTSPEQDTKRSFDLEAAGKLLISHQPLDYRKLLSEIDVLYLGEHHNDYSIAGHLLDQVEAFRESGVKTFAVELNPKDQPILDEINGGDFSNIDKLEFSSGFGSITVEAKKRELVHALVNNGIRIVGVANWDKGIEGNESIYNLESEQTAAGIIEERAKLGKVVILIGAAHSFYVKGDLRYPFVRSPDVLREKGIKVKTASFIGGMDQLGEYDRSVEAYLRRASVNLGMQDKSFYIDSTGETFPLTKYNNDGLIHLPHCPFRSARDRQEKPGT